MIRILMQTLYREKALNLYLQHYPQIAQVYQIYLQEKWNTSSLPTQQALLIQESQENA